MSSILTYLLKRGYLIQTHYYNVLCIGVCMVRLARFFSKFVTEPIEIAFVIIKTDAYQLGSVFRPMAVRFDRLGLIDLVGLI